MIMVNSNSEDGDFPHGYAQEWRDFISVEHESKDIFNMGRIFPLQRQEESRKMLEVCNKIQPKTIMEIGADKGGGIWLWAKCIPTLTNLIAIEPRGTIYIPLLQRAFPHVDFLGLAESSLTRQCINKVKDWLNQHNTKIDVLFVDGDKSFFKLDAENYLPYMSSNGIILFHDIQDGPTGTAFREFVAKGYSSHEIIDKTDAILALKDEARGVPCKGSHDQWLRAWGGRSCGVGVVYLS